jgi:hypothetical protein
MMLLLAVWTLLPLSNRFVLCPAQVWQRNVGF